MAQLENQATAVVPEGKILANFRSSLDIENFYRFVNDNNLRREAKLMLDYIYGKVVVKKKRRGRAKKTVLQ